ncbi:hypothetical protein GTY54_01420 [Streptomyces sp. SID625]|nr:hypothetical protein [Streptomyces sp. SID625]
MPLTEQVRAGSGGTCGVHRTTRALKRKDVRAARRTVEPLMEDVLRGRRCRTTVPEPSAPDPGPGRP